MTIKRILIADDEEMITRLCRKVLTKEGYHVSTVCGGEEALKIASSDVFDMIVTDMLMPGMSGVETFLTLREKYHEIIGVLITGHGTMDMAIEAMGNGFSGFLRKPFTAKELIRVVNESLQKAELKEENARLKTLIPLLGLGEKFIASYSEKEIFNELIEVIFRETGSQRISIMIYDEKEGCLRMEAARGIREEMLPEIRIMPGEKIAGKVFEKGEPLILNGGPDENPVFMNLLKSRDIIAAILFPMKAKDRCLGVLNVSKMGKGKPFSSSDIELLSIICGQAVMALDNLHVMEEKEEKVRVRTILEQYVSPEVANLLLSHSRNPMEIGEIRRITVLFADIRNFTPLVQSLSLKKLRAFLNDFFYLLSEIVFKSNGTLDKFMGDALLAFFGEPVQIERPVDSALSSAVIMHNAFKELKERWSSENEAIKHIGLGVGISTGKIFLGNVGSQKRFDFTVLGADVNIAQRLATEAASGEILVTQSVKNEMGPEFYVKEESSRSLKGIKTPIPIYSILGQ